MRHLLVFLHKLYSVVREQVCTVEKMPFSKYLAPITTITTTTSLSRGRRKIYTQNSFVNNFFLFSSPKYTLYS